jgi:hypothetical protein
MLQPRPRAETYLPSSLGILQETKLLFGECKLFKRFGRPSYERLICFDKFMNREGVYEHTRVLS